MWKRLGLFFGIILLTGGILMLLWGILPSKMIQETDIIQPDSMALPQEIGKQADAVLDARQVKIKWPSFVHTGDSSEVYLEFTPILNGSESQASEAGFINVYDHYNLMAEGKLEAAGLNVNPDNPRRESMPPGQTVNFKWTISPQEEGSYSGRVWLSLRYLPLDGSNPSQAPIYAGEINIRAKSFLGLNGPTVRLLGGILLIFSSSWCITMLLRTRKIRARSQRAQR